MSYLFLTGATGLLGTYLLRDFASHGVRVVALVRSTKFASAEQRVEDALSRWEGLVGHTLPRPIVLEGDISKPGLGLDDQSRDWVSRHCSSLMHNAASLTFHAESPEGEPWRSNVNGTRNVLEFCRQTGIRDFHHVSTSYVCGLRTDLAREDELDVGQELGNDYEISKVQAEKMVYAADHLEQRTFYRPAIIVGDSEDGYTTTFHGFYVPLKLLSALVGKTSALKLSRDELAAINRASSERLRELLNLDGSEQKNYVPVDWVSAVMAHVYAHPEHHGKTYHLTPANRVPVTTMQSVFEQAFTDYTVSTSSAEDTSVDWMNFEKYFVEQMGVYRSYWRNDPVFDSTNTMRAAPHLPCPRVDREMLLNMCRYAMDSNFGWPRPKSAVAEFDVDGHLALLAESAQGAEPEESVRVVANLEVNGPGGGQWQLAEQGGALVVTEAGLAEDASTTVFMNSQTFAELASGPMSIEESIATGRTLVEGALAEAGGLSDERVSEVVARLLGRVEPFIGVTTPTTTKSWE